MSAINATNITEDSSDNSNTITSAEQTVNPVENTGQIVNTDNIKTISKTKQNESDKKSANSRIGDSEEFKKLLKVDSTHIQLFKDYVLDDVVIRKSMTIDGRGHTISGNFSSRILRVYSDNVVLKNIVFVKGNNEYDEYGSAIYWRGSNGLIQNCTFKQNQKVKQYVHNNSNTRGAAVYSEGKSLKILNSKFIENSAMYGGAIYVDAKDNLISNCTFMNNQRYAIYDNINPYEKKIPDYIKEEYQCLAGGAIYIDNEGSIIKDCLFQSNKAYQASAIYINKNNNLIDNCKFINNSAQNSSTVFVNGNYSRIKNSYFINNKHRKTLPITVYSTDNMIAENCWWGNGRNSNPTGMAGNVILDGWYYLDIIDSKNSDLQSMKDLTAPPGGENIFDLVFINNKTGEIVQIVNDTDFKIISRDKDNLLVTNANTSIIYNPDNTKIRYVPLQGSQGNIIVEYCSKRFTYPVRHVGGTTYTDLNNLIKSTKGNTIILTQDYKYNPTTDTNLKSGVYADYRTIDGNGHSIDASGSNGVFEVANNVILKNMNIINSVNAITGYANLTLINVTTSNSKDFISTMGNVNIINSTIIGETKKAVNIREVPIIKKSGQVIIDNSKIINTSKAITGKCNVNITNTLFENTTDVISKCENVTVENSEFINNHEGIRSSGNVNIDNCNFRNVSTIFVSDNSYKLKTYTEVKISNSMIYDANSDKNIIDAFKNNVDINNCTFMDIKSKVSMINLDDCNVNIHDSDYVNNNAKNILEYDADSKNTFNVTKNIFINNQVTNDLVSASDNVKISYNWFGNTRDNYNKKLIKSENINNWAILDAKYNNNAQTEVLIELDEIYDDDNNKNETFDGINTKLNVTYNNNTKELTLTNGKGIINIEDSTRGETDKITVNYYNNKYNIELTRKNIGSLNDLKNYIESGNGNVTLEKDYQYDETSDKELTDGITIDKAGIIDGNGHTVDGLHKTRIFNIKSDNVTIKNIKLINGNHEEQAGAIYWNASNGNLYNSTLANNFAPNGGAVYLAKDNNRINQNIFNENDAGLYGGAVYVGQKDTTLTNNLFENNHAMAGENYAVYTQNDDYIKTDENNTFINNTKADFGGDATDEEDTGDITPSHHKKIKQFSTVNRKNYIKQVFHDKKVITINNKEIPLTNNQLTLNILNQIFNQNFTNGHLLVYIDGKLVFNGTTTDDLSQLICNLFDLLSGNHEIRVEFTDKEGNTNTFTENIKV